MAISKSKIYKNIKSSRLNCPWPDDIWCNFDNNLFLKGTIKITPLWGEGTHVGASFHIFNEVENNVLRNTAI